MNTQRPHRSRWSQLKLGCTLFALVVVGAGLFGAFLVNRALTNFDSYRDLMGIRDGLVVQNERLRYSPGFDDAMWCRFEAKANSIDEVFDAKIDTSEFSKVGYKIGTDWIKNGWWDPGTHELTGNEVQTGTDLFLNVAYVKNGDGTLTVYNFWFEV